MFINLTNIDFCPGSGGGSANLQEDKSVTYTTNGNYTITPDEGYDGLSSVGVTVNYDGTDYRNQTGTVDVDGLRAIGWNEASIGYFNANVLHYPWENDNYKVTDGNKALYGVVNSSNISNYSNDPNLIYCPYFDMTGVTSMFLKFSSKYLQGIPLLDTSSVTDMNYAFYGCYLLKSIPLLNTSSVTRTEYMFSYCKSLQSIPLLNTSSVTSMDHMFEECRLLRSIPQLDTSSVTNMGSMFYNCEVLQSIPQLDTSKVTSMNDMFYGCTSLKTIPQLDTSSVTSMGAMFYNCTGLQSIPELNTSNVTNTSFMFSGYISDMYIKRIEGLDMSSVTNADSMFRYCSSLSYIRLNGNLNVGLDISATSELDYDSVKSILTAASNTVNTDSKTLYFNSKQTDQNGELAALVATCTSKGWTISGLTLN